MTEEPTRKLAVLLHAEDVDFPRYAANHARICKRQEDADNWFEGYGHKQTFSHC